MDYRYHLCSAAGTRLHTVAAVDQLAGRRIGCSCMGLEASLTAVEGSHLRTGHQAADTVARIGLMLLDTGLIADFDSLLDAADFRLNCCSQCAISCSGSAGRHRTLLAGIADLDCCQVLKSCFAADRCFDPDLAGSFGKSAFNHLCFGHC